MTRGNRPMQCFFHAMNEAVLVGLDGSCWFEAAEDEDVVLMISMYRCLCLLSISVTVTSVFNAGCNKKKT